MPISKLLYDAKLNIIGIDVSDEMIKNFRKIYPKPKPTGCP